MRASVYVASVGLVLAGSVGCASKTFVRTQIDHINRKVDSLGTALEETQERVRKNEGRISDVDQKTQAAATVAQGAQRTADAANQKALAANETAAAAAARLDAVDKAGKRLVYELALSEEQGNFTFGKATLPASVKARIDALVRDLKADPKGGYFEIEGHTDNVGEASANLKLGEARADAVKRYLYEQHQIPLHRINVISFGADKPLATNKTKAGRAQNRAVVIRVLI
jgi:outer membrane protein OmpA-like peptidoglycan-associated protein